MRLQIVTRPTLLSEMPPIQPIELTSEGLRTADESIQVYLGSDFFACRLIDGLGDIEEIQHRNNGWEDIVLGDMKPGTDRATEAESAHDDFSRAFRFQRSARL